MKKYFFLLNNFKIHKFLTNFNYIYFFLIFYRIIKYNKIIFFNIYIFFFVLFIIKYNLSERMEGKFG